MAVSGLRHRVDETFGQRWNSVSRAHRMGQKSPVQVYLLVTEKTIEEKLVGTLAERDVERDLTIEIEHLVPVASGSSGQNNLRPACGWCNRCKGAGTSLYEASFIDSKRSFRIGTRNFRELPEPFRIIRLLAVTRSVFGSAFEFRVASM